MNAMTSVNQELPNNIEAEQQVLGALLNDNSLAYMTLCIKGSSPT